MSKKRSAAVRAVEGAQVAVPNAAPSDAISSGHVNSSSSSSNTNNGRMTRGRPQSVTAAVARAARVHTEDDAARQKRDEEEAEEKGTTRKDKNSKRARTRRSASAEEGGAESVEALSLADSAASSGAAAAASSRAPSSSHQAQSLDSFMSAELRHYGLTCADLQQQPSISPLQPVPREQRLRQPSPEGDGAFLEPEMSLDDALAADAADRDAGRAVPIPAPPSGWVTAMLRTELHEWIEGSGFKAASPARPLRACWQTLPSCGFGLEEMSPEERREAGHRQLQRAGLLDAMLTAQRAEEEG